MKKIFILFIFCLGFKSSFGQVSAQVFIDPPPSIFVSDYVGSTANKVHLILTNMASVDANIYVEVEIKRTDGEVVVNNTTNHFKSNISKKIPAGVGSTIAFDRFNYGSLFNGISENDLFYKGISQNSVITQPSLPEGIYTYCIYVYDYATDQLLTQACTNLNLMEYAAPQITSPICGEDLMLTNKQQPVIIQWTTTPVPKVKYEIKIVELPEGVTAQDAIANASAGLNVVVNKQKLNSPILVLTQADNIIWKNGATYAMQVKAVASGSLIKNEGLSELCTFVYKLNSTTSSATARTSSVSGLHLLSPLNNKIFATTELVDNLTFTWSTFPLAANQKYFVLIKRSDKTSTNIYKSAGTTNSISFPITDFDFSDCSSSNPCMFMWDVDVVDISSTEVIQKSETFYFSSSTTPTTSSSDGASTGSSGGSAHRTGAAAVSCSTVSTSTYAINSIINLSDNFKMKLTANPTGTNASLSGEGVVYVKWLGNVSVQFQNISINSSDQLCAGNVFSKADPGQNYPMQWAAMVSSTSVGSWAVNQIRSVVNSIKVNKITKPLIQAVDDVSATMSAPLKMPIGYYNNNDTTNLLALTEMVFAPNQANFDAVASLNTTKIFKNSTLMNNTSSISLNGSGIIFTESGLKGCSGSITLAAPLSFSFPRDAAGSADPDPLNLTFKTGTGVLFGSTPGEHWTYKIDADLELPKAWLLPTDPLQTTVKAGIFAEIKKWNEFVVTGTLDACLFPNSNGLGMDATTIVLDNSENENSPLMNFPDGYVASGGQSGDLFVGLYINNLGFTLPNLIKKYSNPSGVLTASLHDLIVDKDGVFANFLATNLAQFPDAANVGNMAASIDTVKLTIVKTRITSAYMSGKIILPSSNIDPSNSLYYKGLFVPASATSSSSLTSTGGNAFTFTLKPINDIHTGFLGDGVLTLEQTSVLNLSIKKNAAAQREVKINLDLNGELKYPIGSIGSGAAKLDLDFDTRFEHLKLDYNNLAPTNKMTFDPGVWAFASPQKKFCKFSFAITEIKPDIQTILVTDPQNFLFKGGVKINALMSIGTEKVSITGSAGISLIGAIQATNGTVSGSLTATDYDFDTHFDPVFVGVSLNKIGVDVNLSAAQIKGDVEFMKNDLVYGNGFKGNLSVKFKSIDVYATAGAIFGNTKYIPGNTKPAFKYWMVQAQVKIPAPGIPFMSGVAFYGFGAGVYSKMRMVKKLGASDTFDINANNATTFGQVDFIPDDTVTFGFKVKALIGTTPKEETFNGSVGLSAQFSATNGLQFIAFDGTFACGSKIGEESSAFANGVVHAAYDFPTKTFDFNSTVNINKAPISTPSVDPETHQQGINTKIHTDGLTGKWYFKCGTPTNPNIVRLSLGTDLDICSYLEFGNDIEIPHGFMPETNNGFTSLNLSVPGFNDNATSEGSYKSAAGFCFGLGVNAKTDGSDDLFRFHGNVCDCERYCSYDYHVAAGAEVDASFLQYSGCPGLGKGWRAKLSLAAYAGANINYSYSVPVLGYSSGSLADFKAGCWATAEFPNTFYMEGQVDGEASILDDCEACPHTEISFHRHFTFGNQCGGSVVTTTAPTYTYHQENLSDSLKYSLIKSIVVPVANAQNVSRGTDIKVLANYPYNESFDMPEQQADGTVKKRTFRVLFSPSLIVENPPSGALISSAAMSSVTLSETTPLSSTGTLSASTASATGLHSTTTSTTHPSTSVVSSTPPRTSSAVSSHHTTDGGGTSSAPLGMSSSISTAAATLIQMVEIKEGGYDEFGAKILLNKSLVEGSFLDKDLNGLKANTSYKFKVNAQLQELKSGLWVGLRYHNNPALPEIKDSRTIYFKTNGESLIMSSSSSSSTIDISH